MSISMIAGIVISTLLMVSLAILSGMHRKKTEALGFELVSGLILGTFVGGSCTVGTAQLAYCYGICAWWYTLGGAIACLILALRFVKPFRKEHCKTVAGMITHEYGETVGVVASILNALGTFINILSQIIAATSVIAVILPGLGTVPALLISVICMILYVVFGGTRGAGIVGMLKLALIYISMLGCGAIVLRLTGGLSNFVHIVNDIDDMSGVRFFSMFGRGVGTDVGACLSLIVGIVTTQTYAQAVIAAKNETHARVGALLSALMLPLIGAGGILVGLYMRATCPGIAAKTALTQFVQTQMPNLLGGIVLGTLFIAVVGTGAGLALGVASILNNDLLQRVTKRFSVNKQQTVVNVLICSVLVFAAVLCTLLGSDMILNFAVFSMGLRGAVILVPLCFALWGKGKIPRSFALAAVIAGPATVVVFDLIKCLPFDALFLGVAVSLCIVLIGLRYGIRKKRSIATPII